MAVSSHIACWPQVSLPAGQVAVALERVAADPLVFMGHPAMVATVAAGGEAGSSMVTWAICLLGGVLIPRRHLTGQGLAVCKRLMLHATRCSRCISRILCTLHTAL
jgi:hypothetical protein